MSGGTVRAFLSRPVDYRRSFFRDLGRLAVFLFGVEVVTGILLSLYYRPDGDGAYASVGTIVSHVTLGWLVRGVHLVAAHLLTVVVGLYLVRAFFLRTFLRPNGTIGWVLAVAVSFLTLAFLLTGSVLPWDETAYWRTVMTAELVGKIPVLGPWLAGIFRGGPEVSGATLVRLAALHGMLFPWLAFGLILLGRRIRREGGMR
jgi:quinol-cytochrome oxidoreductase complex cytochrome b subunit